MEYGELVLGVYGTMALTADTVERYSGEWAKVTGLDEPLILCPPLFTPVFMVVSVTRTLLQWHLSG